MPVTTEAKIKVSFNLRYMCTKLLGPDYLYMPSNEQLLMPENKDKKILLDNRDVEKLVNKKLKLGYITDAVFSDYYDTGCVDTYIVDTPVYYSKNSILKVVIHLHKLYNLKLIFNTNELKDADEVKEESDHYEYVFKNISLDKDTVISFKFD